MVKLSDRKIRERILYTVDDEKLAEGLRRCTIFRLFDPYKNKVQYYFGGGFYDRQHGYITMWLDILRPLNNVKVKVSEILHTKFDGTTLDILCKNGVWISSIVLPKIRSDSCSFRYLRFDDERVISYREGVAVVDLPLLEVPVSEINRTTVGYPQEPEIKNYKNPLTVGYVKKDGVVYIGYWDAVENHFVGSLRKYWMKLLDIKL